MYLTQQQDEQKLFDWEQYFSDRNTSQLTPEASSHIVEQLRDFLSEDPLRMTFCLDTLLKRIMCHCKVSNTPNIIELGAASGFLTRVLLSFYPNGKGVLVDNSEASYQKYKECVGDYHNELNIQYCKNDIFTFELDDKFDIVCSFGLLEHFNEKTDILQAHKKFLRPGGYLLILVPTDSLLSRVYWTLHPELNLGYRQLLTLSEYKTELEKYRLDVLSVELCQGYVYDFAAALCQING